MRRVAAAVLLLSASLLGGWTYNPNDYRAGETAHRWPEHGAWHVSLVSGGGDGTGTCMLTAEAGAQQPTLFLAFTEDGQILRVGWGDTNFTATNDQNFHSHEALHTLGGSADLTTLAVGTWVFLQTTQIRTLETIKGRGFAVVPPVFLAWQSPNRDKASPYKNDGPNARSSDQMLARIGEGQTLSFEDGDFSQSIALKGFAAAAKDMRACIFALSG